MGSFQNNFVGGSLGGGGGLRGGSRGLPSVGSSKSKMVADPKVAARASCRANSTDSEGIHHEESNFEVKAPKPYKLQKLEHKRNTVILNISTQTHTLTHFYCLGWYARLSSKSSMIRGSYRAASG